MYEEKNKQEKGNKFKILWTKNHKKLVRLSKRLLVENKI